MTLASFFIEMKVAPSPHWIHVQVSPPNELAMAKLLQLARRNRWGERGLRQLSRHLLIALCGMHSDLGGHHLLALSRDGGGPPRLTVETIARRSFPRSARLAARRLREVMAGAGALAIFLFVIGGMNRRCCQNETDAKHDCSEPERALRRPVLPEPPSRP